MATSHYCDGKWRPGTLAECDRHKRLDKKQSTVYDRSVEGPKASSSTSSSSSSSDSSTSSSSSSSSGSSSSGSTSND